MAPLPEGWSEVSLGEIATLGSGKWIPDASRNAGAYPVFGANGIIGHTTSYLTDEDLITIGRVGSCGLLNRVSGRAWISDNALIARPKQGVVLGFLWALLQRVDFQTIRTGSTQPLITQTAVAGIKVQLPPLVEQRAIVRLLEKADTLVGAAQNTTERGRRLRRTLLETVLAGDQASDWPRVLVGDIAVLEYGRALQESKRKGGKYPVYGSAGQVGNHEEALTPAGVTIVGRKGTAGRVSWSEVAVWPIDTTYWVRILSGTVDAHYLHLALDQAHLASLSQQTGVPGLNRELVYALMIPLPPLPLQQTIVRLFQKMDATIRAAEKELLKSQSLRAALLEDLLTGRHRLVDSGR